ncbi:MAG: ABC transporter ATP-binding protein [Clostridiales bacterium]|nr:ABC transporter ATP-binding protein [Clostridiales bacterium]
MQCEELNKGIITKELKVGYDGRIIVPSFDIRIQSGKITSVIGANGCGKSTVLKAIGRIIRSDSGCVIINGTDMAEMKNKEIAKQMAILPQTPTAPGTLTCHELVAYGRFPYQKGLGKLSQEDKRIVEWSLEATNMINFRNRPIASLSGGQRQRVWIAMALAQQTGIILLDEPTTYLDLAHQLEVLELLKHLNENERTTIVMVLHDLNLASRYSDYLLAMLDGQMESYGTPSEVMTKRMLCECFGIDGDIMTDPRSGKPLCISYDLVKSERANPNAFTHKEGESIKV